MLRTVPRGSTGLLFLAAFLLAPQAHADYYLVTLTGTVDSVDAPLSGTFSAGQTLNSSYVFDSSTPPVAGSNSTFAVYNALVSLNFSIDGYSAFTTGAPEIQVDNDPPSPFSDRYGVVSRAGDGLTGAAVNGNPLTFFGFRLDDSTNSVFTSALILPTNLSISSFDNRRFFVFFDTQLVSGTVDRITFSAVPEPGALTLGLVGLGSVGLVRLCRRRGWGPWRA